MDSETIIAIVIFMVNATAFIFFIINLIMLIKIRKFLENNYDNSYDRKSEPEETKNLQEETDGIDMNRNYSRRELEMAIKREQTKLNQAKKVLKKWR